MTDYGTLRRAVSAAQAILKEVDSSMLIDGKAGSYTLGVYSKAGKEIRTAVDNVMMALGVSGSLVQANREYTSAKASATAAPTDVGSKRSIFDLRVIPAVTREARKRGLNPVNFVTQLALESGYGAKTPLRADGTPTYNYGGIKWNSVKTKERASAKTNEGSGENVERITDTFAVFDSPEEFAVAYFYYLFNGPSSYRYKGLEKANTPLEFGTILQNGGYAGKNREYASTFANAASSVARKYALA